MTSTASGSARWPSSASIRACCPTVLVTPERAFPLFVDLLRPRRISSFRTDKREKEMIAPLAVDAKVFACVSFFLEAHLGQHALACRVGRQTRRLEAVELKCFE